MFDLHIFTTLKVMHIKKFDQMIVFNALKLNPSNKSHNAYNFSKYKSIERKKIHLILGFNYNVFQHKILLRLILIHCQSKRDLRCHIIICYYL